MAEVPGRSFVTRRALVDVIRAAVLGSYGVTGFSDRNALRRALARVGVPPRGIELSLGQGVDIELAITIAHGLPVAEVVRQVDSAVRHGVRRALGRDVRRLQVHVNGLRLPAVPARAQPPPSIASPVPVPVPKSPAREAAGDDDEVAAPDRSGTLAVLDPARRPGRWRRAGGSGAGG